jgi:hypothetical protein
MEKFLLGRNLFYWAYLARSIYNILAFRYILNAEYDISQYSLFLFSFAGFQDEIMADIMLIPPSAFAACLLPVRRLSFLLPIIHLYNHNQVDEK